MADDVKTLTGGQFVIRVRDLTSGDLTLVAEGPGGVPSNESRVIQRVSGGDILYLDSTPETLAVHPKFEGLARDELLRQGVVFVTSEGVLVSGDAPIIIFPTSDVLVRSDVGITGTGTDVDTWDTQTASGLTLTAQGANRPQNLANLVEMDNAATQTNFFRGGDTSTFQAMTQTGIFAFGWRGRIDAYDSPVFTIDMSILHTRASSGRGVNLFIYAGGSSMSFVTWNGGGGITHRCDFVSFNGSYTLGDALDVVVIGDGVDMRMYLNGVQVGTTGTIAADAGVHAQIAEFGKLTNGALYHIGAMEGVFYNAGAEYGFDDVAEIRSLLTVGA